MNLYLVERHDTLDYEETESYVCVALNGQGARDLGVAVTGNQPSSVWHLPSTTVGHLGRSDETDPRVVLTSHTGA